MKINDIRIHAATWIHPEINMLSETSQTERTNADFSHIAKTQTFIMTENRLEVISDEE